MDTRELIANLETSIGSQVLGQQQSIRHILLGLLANGHVLLESLPGLAKTRTVKALSTYLDAHMSRIQFTPDLLPSDITGGEILQQTETGNQLRFQPGPLFGNVILADEINRAPAKVQAALLEAMEERQITLELPPPSAAGVVNLYSRDFYQLAARRLQENGVVAQWLPLPMQNDEDSRSLVRSFIDVFPYASLWTTEFHEMLLVGSLQPLQLDVPRIRQRFEQPEIAAALSAVGIDSAQALLATWITDREGLVRYAGDASPVTDDQPRIEYAPWVRSREITRVLPTLLALRTPPPLEGAEASFRGAVDDQWQSLRRFYGLSLHAYRGERDAWARDVRQIAREEGGNPYYRWFLGGQ